uniref:Uncharacterized protein n=1 Tax=Dicentrarchus labrax TaxID=13489 RepID=A0A8C4I1K5_DICLA
MDLPFSGFELTFIIIAFVIFSLFSLASVCIQPQAQVNILSSKLMKNGQREDLSDFDRS